MDSESKNDDAKHIKYDAGWRKEAPLIRCFFSYLAFTMKFRFEFIYYQRFSF